MKCGLSICYGEKCLLLFVVFLGHFFSSFGQERGAVALATEKISSGKTYAIIVGVSEYASLKSLNYADNDAILFKHFLMSSSGGEVPEDNIKLMLNAEATSTNFWVNGISWLESKPLKKGDKVYLFMAGHGDAINESEFFFLTHDCQPGNDKNNYILTGNIQLYNLKSRIRRWTSSGVSVVLALDACRTGDLPGGTDGQSFFATSVAEMRSGEIMLLSASPNQVSFEDKSFGGGHGLFTFYLVEGLSGKADEDSDGTVTLAELQDYVKKNVRLKSKEKFKTYQIPFFCCSENELTPIALVDEKFAQEFKLLTTLGDLYSNELIADVGTGRGVKYEDSKSADVYKKFHKALVQNKFEGVGCARQLLDSLVNINESDDLLKQARRDLAIAYLNFGQARINLYLSGQDKGSIKKTIKELSEYDKNLQIDDYFELKVSALEQLAGTSFENSARLMREAVHILEADTNFEDVFESRIKFLELYSQRHLIQVHEKDSWLNQINKLLAIDTSAGILNLAGLIYSDLELNQESILYYQRAILSAPKWSYPANNIAIGLSKLGRLQEAEQWAKKSIEIDVLNYNSHNTLGTIYKKLLKHELAKECFLRSIELNKDDPVSYNNVGHLFYELKDFTAAENYFIRAIIADSIYIPAYTGLTKLYNEQKQLQKAIDLLINLNQRVPGSSIYQNWLGNTYYIAEDFINAIAAYEKAIGVDSTFYKAYLNRAFCELMIQNYNGSKGSFELYKRHTINKLNLNKLEDAALNMGFKKVKEKKNEEAKKTFEFAFQLEKSERSGFEFANYLYLNSFSSESETLISEIIDSCESRLMRAKLLEIAVKASLDIGDINKSISYFEKLTEINIKLDEVLQILFYSETGATEKAKEIRKRVNPLLLSDQYLISKYTPRAVVILKSIK
jgi:tetratricopeptide (TPR) repeat protein